jgi:hypothetical protein
MKLLRVVLLGFGVVTATNATALQPSERAETTAHQFVRGAYIVELNDGGDADRFLDELRSSGLEVKGRRRLSSRFFNGLSFEVLNSNEADHVSLSSIGVYHLHNADCCSRS